MIKERIKRNRIYFIRASKSKIVRSAAFFALGFVFSTGSVLGGLHPFGISIVAVSKKKYFLFTALGAALGTVITGFDAYSARYLSGIAIAALGAFAAGAFDLNFRPSFSMAISFIASLSTGIILNVRLLAPVSEYVLITGESILCCGSAFFFYKSLYANYKRLRLNALPISDITCITVSVCIMLMNLSSLKIAGISPARLVAAALILTALRYFGERKGLIAAISIGFAFSISGGETLFITGAFAFSAMAGALFLPLGTLATGGAFLLSTAFFCIASGSAEALPLFIETALGAVIFILLPSRLTDFLESISEPDAVFDGSLRQSLVLKLRFASSAMAAISESVEQVREKINEIARRENDLKKDGLSREELISREMILEKTNQIRMVASDQFFSIADMLEDLAFEFDDAEIFDAAASSKIRRLLGDYEIYPLNISVIEDKYSRMRVEILADRTAEGLDNPKLTREIGKICSRYFENGRITNFKDETMLSFFEKPNYSLSVGFAQYSAEGRLCGDTVKTINDGKGHSILIISDGMGKGSRAALDGAMGAGLISRLLGAGFGFDSALKIVNCALLVKSNDESLATLDIANIDLFTGKCELFKAGAPASYIIKNDIITKCELSSMPAGILRGIEFAKRTAVLRLDDTIFLLSDGICELGEDWLKSTLLSLRALPSQKAADALIEEALLKSENQKRDDMSVICAKLKRNQVEL